MIPKLINLCSIYIAKKYESKEKEFILNIIKPNLPLELIEIIYYRLLINYSSIGTPNQQNNLLGNIARKDEYFILKPHSIKIRYPNNRVKSKDFYFFSQLHNLDFVDVTSNKSFLELLHYTNVCLNLNINNIEKILSNYINFNHDKCVLAGGHFSEYQYNLFAKSFPLFYDYFVKNKDIDIFLMDTNNQKYDYYVSKFEHLNFKILQGKNSDYKFYSIKIDSNGFILNMIFINNMKYNNIVNYIADSFDFNLAKIFYSFDHKKLFFQFNCLNLM